MRKFIVPAIIIGLLLSILAAGSGQVGLLAAPQDERPQPPGGQENAVKVTITTGGGLFGPQKDRFRVGERIPVVITMTNVGREPVYVCDSGTLYQDRPRLTKDGQPVPYLSLQKLLMQDSERDKTCEKLDLPDQRLLRPGEPTVVDWFILSEGKTPMGDLSWYEPLQPGKYELSTLRRLDCCEGPMVESDKISFEVVP